MFYCVRHWWLFVFCVVVVFCLFVVAKVQSNVGCDNWVNDMLNKLVLCVMMDDLWNHMQVLQVIVDVNLGVDGYLLCNFGELGYKVLVDYVVAVMCKVGYDVTI